MLPSNYVRMVSKDERCDKAHVSRPRSSARHENASIVSDIHLFERNDFKWQSLQHSGRSMGYPIDLICDATRREGSKGNRSFQYFFQNTCIRFSLLLGPISFRDFFPRFLSKISCQIQVLDFHSFLVQIIHPTKMYPRTKPRPDDGSSYLRNICGILFRRRRRSTSCGPRT